VPGSLVSRPVAAGVVGCLAFLLIGWSSLVVPSLIRSIRDAFGQDDAGIGVWYFAYAVSYASGSFGGGFAIERLGRRVVLPLGAALLGGGLLALGLAPAWGIFLLAAVPAGLGSGAIDGGSNGLFLDLYRTGRGRALNVLHLFFSLGALSAPLAIGRLVEGGTDWRAVVVGTGLAAVPVGLLFAAVRMPAGRRAHRSPPTVATPLGGARRLSLPLVLLGLAIAAYVASEVGVSNWLVRFLDEATLSTATTGLSLYWAGLALGRLVSARIADRFDHLAFTILWVAAMAVALAAAILVPSLEASIALFGLTGFASGPVFPMIVALGGERYPERSAAVSGFLTGVAVTGSVVYPPIMGFLSVTVGLTVAMAGNVVLGVVCAAALIATGWTTRPRRLP
jgi:fucose permease